MTRVSSDALPALTGRRRVGAVQSGRISGKQGGTAENCFFCPCSLRGTRTFLLSWETLTKSSSAEQRIFFPSCAVSKAGNTQSIPPLWKPSSGEKSLAVSSRRLIQSFPVEVLLPIERMRSGKGCVFWKIIFEYCIIRSAFIQGRFPPPIGQNVEKKSRNL